MIRQGLHGDGFVNHVDQALESRVVWIAGIRKVVFHDQTEPTGMRKQNANAGGHFHRFFNVVSDHEDAL